MKTTDSDFTGKLVTVILLIKSKEHSNYHFTEV